MLRKCDGTDPNLLAEDMKSPCTARCEFDDVDHEVIFPHRKLPPKLSLEGMEELLKKYKDIPYGHEHRRIQELPEWLSE